MKSKLLVSVPRCGQLMTEKLLSAYHNVLGIKYGYCEFYSCCLTRPCAHQPDSFQKSHDFDLDDAVDTNGRYAFIFRSDIAFTADAWFRYEAKRSGHIVNTNQSIDYANKDFSLLFERFASEKASYLNRIHGKWLYQGGPSVIAVPYDQFVDDPVGTLSRLLDHFEVPVIKSSVHEATSIVRPSRRDKLDAGSANYSRVRDILSGNGVCLNY